MSKWDDADQFARDLVLCVTAPVTNDELQGLLMIAGFAVTDRVITTAYAVEQLVTLPFRVIGLMR